MKLVETILDDALNAYTRVQRENVQLHRELHWDDPIRLPEELPRSPEITEPSDEALSLGAAVFAVAMYTCSVAAVAAAACAIWKAVAGLLL